MKYKRNTKKGFSLIEVVLSIGVLSVGLLGIMVLYSNSLLYMFSIRDQATAGALVQEGMELVRNLHDNDDSILVGNNYRIEIDNGGNIVMNSGTKILQYSNTTGLGTFQHTGSGQLTKFRRTIVTELKDLDGDGDSNDWVIASFVSWNGQDPPTTALNCTTSNKCVYAVTELFSH